MNRQKFTNFEDAGREVLKFLHQHFEFDLCMITRVEGQDWIVLQAEDHGYNVKTGQVFQWADSFCCHMVKGNGPKIAPSSDAVELYASAPINQTVTIKSYIGQPIINEDGSLFGTLCAIHPHVKSESIVEDLGLVELLGNLLSRILQADLRQFEHANEFKNLRKKLYKDELTGLYNRRAWEEFIHIEEERCKNYGHPAAIFFIDINDLKQVNDNFGHAAGDVLIQRAAHLLVKTVRTDDIVARLGGDEFVILSMENNAKGAEQLFKRIVKAFAEAQISISIGFSMRVPSKGLLCAAEDADKEMYLYKKRLKSHAVP